MILCILFSLFIIKHFICDFWLQTSSMIAEKGTYGAKGGIEHALIHTVATLMILLIFLEPISLALILAAVDGLIHYHIDWAKMKYTRDLTTSD